MKIKRKEPKMTEDYNSSDYVGYKPPPFKSRWKKGQSGNYHGRPKKDESFRGIAERELKKEVSLKENGRIRRVSLKVAIVKRCLADAAQGKIRNLEFLLKILNQSSPIQAEEELTAQENELWSTYFKGASK